GVRQTRRQTEEAVRRGGRTHPRLEQDGAKYAVDGHIDAHSEADGNGRRGQQNRPLRQDSNGVAKILDEVLQHRPALPVSVGFLRLKRAAELKRSRPTRLL